MKSKTRNQILLLVILAMVIVGIRFRNMRESAYDTGVPEQGNVQEQMEENKTNSDDIYLNRKIYTYHLDSQTVLHVGCKEKEGDAIYLNICCDQAKKGNEIGYYLIADRGYLESNDMDGQPVGQGKNEGETDFYIVDRFYSEVVPIRYQDHDAYGVKWYDDLMYDGTKGGATISVRAVNLDNGAYVGMCHVEISYDEDAGTYEITSVHSADAVENGLITYEEKEQMAKQAIAYLGDKFLFLQEEPDWIPLVTDCGVVEKVNTTYFTEVLYRSGLALKPHLAMEIENKYAYTIPLSYYGLITLYYAPVECVEEVLGTTTDRERLETVSEEERKTLILWGYDALNPWDEDTLLVPPHFWEKI